MKQNKLQAGVWLDNEKAIIIATSPEEGGYAVLEKIKAHGSHSGGSEHTINNAKQSDSLKYYKQVAGSLINFDEILVFGPGKSQEQFQNHLHEDAQFKNKKVTIDSAEHLTDPQMVAKVRDFFS